MARGRMEGRGESVLVSVCRRLNVFTPLLPKHQRSAQKKKTPTAKKLIVNQFLEECKRSFVCETRRTTTGSQSVLPPLGKRETIVVVNEHTTMNHHRSSRPRKAGAVERHVLREKIII